MRNLNNCWRGTRGRELGSTSLCRSMLTTRRSRLWQSKERMCGTGRARVQCSNDVLDGALAVDGFSQKTGARRSSSCIWWEQVLWQIVGE